MYRPPGLGWFLAGCESGFQLLQGDRCLILSRYQGNGWRLRHFHQDETTGSMQN